MRTERHVILKIGTFLALGVLPSFPHAGSGSEHPRIPALTTPHFAFYSDFATNLNDALIAAGDARNHGKPELFHSGPEASCFGELPPSVRTGWNLAVGYYAEIVSPAQWSDRQQHLLRVDLAGFDEELQDADSRQFAEIARSFRAAATPAYEACRWSIQDAKNRSWIEAMRPRLAAHEQAIAQRLEKLYQKQWNGLPIPVDVVETVDWSGANSILRQPAGGHLLISTAYQGSEALEIVFHESSHLLMDRGDPMQKALEEAAKGQSVSLPGDFWHVVLFYTTGDAVRRTLDDAGEPGYTPIVLAIFARNGPWTRYRAALESAWPAYMKGERTLTQAAGDLIRALPGPAKP